MARYQGLFGLGLLGVVTLSCSGALAPAGDDGVAGSDATEVGGASRHGGGMSSTATRGRIASAGGRNSIGSTTSRGGSSAMGGNLSRGSVTLDGPKCTNVAPCGGDVVGKWTVVSSCLTVSGEVNLTPLGVGCSSAPVSGMRSVTGTWIVGADGTIEDRTVTKGTEQIDVSESCLNVLSTVMTCERFGGILSVFGYATADCKDAATGGGCTCIVTVEQAGGAGLVSYDALQSGKYAVAGNVLTNTTEQMSYSYCVGASTLSLSPDSTESMTGTVTGAFLLQKSGT